MKQFSKYNMGIKLILHYEKNKIKILALPAEHFIEFRI
jgi:hypothetical protein